MLLFPGLLIKAAKPAGDLSPEEAERLLRVALARKAGHASGRLPQRAPVRRTEPWDIGSRPAATPRAYDAEASRRERTEEVAQADAATLRRKRGKVLNDPRTLGGMDRIRDAARRKVQQLDRTNPSRWADVVGHEAPHRASHEGLVRHFIANNMKGRALEGVTGGTDPEAANISDAALGGTSVSGRMAPLTDQQQHLTAFYNNPVALPPRDKKAFAQQWHDEHKRLGLQAPPVPEHQVFTGVDGVLRHHELVAEAMQRGEQVAPKAAEQLPAYYHKDKVEAFNRNEMHKLTPTEINQIYGNAEVHSGMTGQTHPELAQLHAMSDEERANTHPDYVANRADRVLGPGAAHRIRDWHVGKVADAIRQGKHHEIGDNVLRKYLGSDKRPLAPPEPIRQAMEKRLARMKPDELGKVPDRLLEAHALHPKANREIERRATANELTARAAEEKKYAEMAANPEPVQPPPVDKRTREGRAAAGVQGRKIGDETVVGSKTDKGTREVGKETSYKYNPFGLGLEDFRNKNMHDPFARTGRVPDSKHLNDSGLAKIAAMVDEQGRLKQTEAAAAPPAVVAAKRGSKELATQRLAAAKVATAAPAPAPAAAPAATPTGKRGRPRTAAPVVAPKARRGRPRKVVEAAPVAPARGRGRPPKIADPATTQPTAGAPAAPTASPARVAAKQRLAQPQAAAASPPASLRGASRTPQVAAAAAGVRTRAAAAAKPMTNPRPAAPVSSPIKEEKPVKAAKPRKIVKAIGGRQPRQPGLGADPGTPPALHQHFPIPDHRTDPAGHLLAQQTHRMWHAGMQSLRAKQARRPGQHYLVASPMGKNILGFNAVHKDDIKQHLIEQTAIGRDVHGVFTPDGKKRSVEQLFGKAEATRLRQVPDHVRDPQGKPKD